MTQRHDEYWAAFLGIESSEWKKPGLSIRPHAGLKGYRGVWCFRHLARTVVSAPEGWVPHLGSRLEGADPHRLVDESFLRDVFGPDFDRVVGPAYHGVLDPSRFRREPSPNVRLLGPDDAGKIEAFRLGCDPNDWENSGLDERSGYAAAYIDGDHILSMAAYRAKTDDVGDLCVMTHPSSRGRGLGAAAVSAVVDRALLDERVLLYQTLESNVGAVRIAKRLGFDHYATHVAIRLNADTPSSSKP